jgi:hypothetical protein
VQKIRSFLRMSIVTIAVGCSSAPTPSEPPVPMITGTAQQALTQQSFYPVAMDMESTGKRWRGLTNNADEFACLGVASTCSSPPPHDTLNRFRFANLRFPVSIQACATIKKATLTFTQAGCLSCSLGMAVSLFRAIAGSSTSWTQSAVSGFCGGDSAAGDPSVFTDFAPTVAHATVPRLASGSGVFSFDVTSDVNAWVNGAPNYGWQLRPDENTTMPAANCGHMPRGANLRILYTELATAQKTGSGDFRPVLSVTGSNLDCTSTKSWQPSTLLDTGSIATLPHAAISPNGTAFAVYVRQAASGANTLARQHTSSGWGASQFLQPAGAASATLPWITMDAAGEALATWREMGNALKRNQYFGGWGTAGTIDGANAVGRALKVEFDGSGNAIAMWVSSSPPVNLYASRRLAGANSTWSPSVVVSVNTDVISAGADGAYSLSVSPNGSAMAVWVDSTARILTARFVPASGWAPPAVAGSSSGGGVRAATNGSDDSVVAWVQSNGSRSDLWAAVYSGSATLGSALVESDDTGSGVSVDPPAAAIDAAGTATVAWAQTTSTNTQLYASSRPGGPSHPWSTPTAIPGISGSPSHPDMGVDSSGNLVLVALDGTFHVVGTHFQASTWSTATNIDANDSGVASGNLDLAVEPNGTALAVWARAPANGSSSNVYGAFYQ